MPASASAAPMQVVAKLRVLTEFQRGGLSDEHQDYEQCDDRFQLHLMYYKQIDSEKYLN
jgi:hypothetical protein